MNLEFNKNEDGMKLAVSQMKQRQGSILDDQCCAPLKDPDIAWADQDEPLYSVVVGSGRALENIDAMRGLMSLGGDRSALGFPNSFPFNCTWSDAIGEAADTPRCSRSM